MALNSVYRSYFQKSQVFIYPMLGLKRGAAFVPKSTYISWPNEQTGAEDKKLICVYETNETEQFKLFTQKVLLKHSRLAGYVKVSEKVFVFTFDFSDLQSDWDNFINGKYSKFSENLKSKILNFFEKNTGNYEYVNSYLYPNKYFDTYAELLHEDVSVLKSVGELCSKPDLDKESLKLVAADLSLIDNSTVNL